MARPSNKLTVYLEIGHKQTFAGALEWPGWCRAGRDETSALQALVAYGARYARVVRAARLGFQAPAHISGLRVVERLAGTVTTDFGAPEKAPTSDSGAVDEAELRRLHALLKACWRALDAAAVAVRGLELQRGPRGGGRDLDGIVAHVVNAEAAYLSRLGGQWKAPAGGEPSGAQAIGAMRQEILKAITASAHGEMPARGPRGGVRWSARYFVRRAAWHVLDHTWEIEDRARGTTTSP